MCVLCQRADRPITREHIFARWLIRQVHGAKLVPSQGALSTAAPLRIARVVVPVCADCNAGWMSGLEVSFRRMLFARPRTGPLQAPDRLTLSRWFTKTAVLLAHAYGFAVAASFATNTLLATSTIYISAAGNVGIGVNFNSPSAPLDVMTDGEARESRVRSVAVLVDDLIAHVAATGTLSSRHGTRLWPLRTHTMRWDTLPVITLVVRG